MADARSRRRLSPNLVAGLVLLALSAGVLLWQRPWESTESTGAPEIHADAATVLADQFRALSAADSEAAFVKAAGSGLAAHTFARDAWAARTALDVRGVELRYLRGGEVADRADGSTTVQAAVSWTAGPDSVVTGTSVRDATVRFRVDPRRDGSFAIRSATSEEPLPLWLAGRVDVQRSSGVRVIAVDGGVPGLDVMSMARKAAGTVRSVVPDVDGDLTVVSPATRALTAALVGRSQKDVDPIAAVTTTVDGGTRTARVIVLNPDQFRTMDARAAQVVVTHEATHQLTEAVGTSPEPWVAEGFADFVALHDDDAPLTLSAGQALRSVRENGAPRALPSAADFGGAGRGLGAVYEEAWLVFRMLGERFDDARIVRFYRDVLKGDSADQAARADLGLTVEQITADWRRYLTNKASTVS